MIVRMHSETVFFEVELRELWFESGLMNGPVHDLKGKWSECHRVRNAKRPREGSNSRTVSNYYIDATDSCLNEVDIGFLMQSIQWICCLYSARGQCLQCNKLDVATVLSSRLVDYIKEMSDRALNCATLLLELQVPVLDELASLLKEWGVGVVVRRGWGSN